MNANRLKYVVFSVFISICKSNNTDPCAIALLQRREQNASFVACLFRLHGSSVTLGALKKIMETEKSRGVKIGLFISRYSIWKKLELWEWRRHCRGVVFPFYDKYVA